MQYRNILICALSLTATSALAAGTLSFSEIDTDGDGRISADEASAAKLSFAAMDTDADGEISVAEFDAAGLPEEPSTASSELSTGAAGAGSSASTGTTYGGSGSSSTLPGHQSQDPSIGGIGEGEAAGGGVRGMDDPRAFHQQSD